MANLSVKNRSGESFLAGKYFRRYFAAGYVAEAITAGINEGRLVYVDGNGAVQIADQNTDVPAMGICYGQTNIPVGAAHTDNPISTWKPKTLGGDRMEMEKIASVRIVEETVKFRMKDETLTGTVTTAGTTAMTGLGTAFLTELQVGDYIVVAGETVRQVDTITSDTAATVSVAFANTAGTLAVTAKNMRNKPVYLGENGTSTKFGKLGIGNICTLAPITGDGISQKVGWIEDEKAIQIDLSMDLTGTVL